MEFMFNVQRVLKPDANGISVILPSVTANFQLRQIIDTLGERSSRAQGLRTIITTSNRFFTTSDQKLYIKSTQNKVEGILKTGIRRLFHVDGGKQYEISPLCLLDFYVHESCQRSGKGLELYMRMLEDAQIDPSQIAIDRPSSKLLSFMRKHFGLSNYVPQNNNFVIYKEFFQEHRPSADNKFENQIQRKPPVPNRPPPKTKRNPISLQRDSVQSLLQYDNTPTSRSNSATPNNTARILQENKQKAEHATAKFSTTGRSIVGQLNNTRLQSESANYRPLPPWAVSYSSNNRY